MSVAAELFGDPDFLRRLEQLDLAARQILAGRSRGERRSDRRGAGTVFADYRSYTRGDDLRYVDWNIYGRLGALFVKEFEVEESANLLLLIDRSLSMDFGRPTKLTFACRVAAALGYIALAHLDRVELHVLPGGEPRTFVGRGQAPHLFEQLVAVRPEGKTDLLRDLGRSLAGSSRGGIAVLISDLYDRRGFEPALEHLLRHRHQVFLLHVASREEAHPEPGGRLRLVDAEDGRRLDLHLTPEAVRRYRHAWRRFSGGVARFALRKEIGYARMLSDEPFGEAVLKLLRKGRVVR